MSKENIIIHEVTQKNLSASKRIIEKIKKYDESIDVGYDCLDEYSDEGSRERWQSVEIWHSYPYFYEEKGKEFRTIVERAVREEYKKDGDILIYCNYDEDKVADFRNKYFSKVYARTQKNVYIDIAEVVHEKYRREIYEKIAKTKEYQNYDEAIFGAFENKYKCDDKKNDSVFLRKIVEKAEQIKQNEGHIVRDITSFLNTYGIFLLIEDKKDISDELDGLCGYIGEKKMPTIILYVDKADIKNLRRCFFTIAHELYHLLYNEGEELANKFAGHLLVSDYFRTKNITIDIENKDKAKEVLKKAHDELGVSFECIINSLLDNKKIDKKQRHTLLQHKKKYIDTDDINLEEEKKWIYTSLKISE